MIQIEKKDPKLKWNGRKGGMYLLNASKHVHDFPAFWPIIRFEVCNEIVNVSASNKGLKRFNDIFFSFI